MDALVFPGQGTFDQCLEALDYSGLNQKLREWVQSRKALLWNLFRITGFI